jgi:hypothetical protein
MYSLCPVTCGICKTKCYDKDVDCAAWARAGECGKNSALYTLCPVSCGTCTDMCLDKANDCPQWAAGGACGTNAAFMLKTCPQSCAVCDQNSHNRSGHPVPFGQLTSDGRKLSGPQHPASNHFERVACADTDRTQCLIWGEQECEANPGAVLKACPATCGVCTLACEDKYADCPQWKLDAGCDKNAQFMLPNCPHSCGICPNLHVFPSSVKDEL